MKRKIISISSIQQEKALDFNQNILLPKEQLKIKGGASPWLEGP